MGKFLRFAGYLLGLVVLAGIVTAGYLTRDQWIPHWFPENKLEDPQVAVEEPQVSQKIILNEIAQQNLALKAKPLVPQTYWKTIQVPGMVVDRPGQSDRGVVAPATGVIAQIYHFPGETLKPGEPLFTIKLLSESLHLTQTDLFKASQDIILAKAQKKRLDASGGAVPEARLIEVDNQITRLEISAKAYRQELLNRGFTPELIDQISSGKFVSEILIVAPTRPDSQGAGAVLGSQPMPQSNNAKSEPWIYEMQELKVELGQQVLAGQTLCLLSNHQALAVEGRAFRDETPLLERSVRETCPVEVDFLEEGGNDWPPMNTNFHIAHLANNIDPVNRTFAFRIPLENQFRKVEVLNRVQLLWRFRPGQKVKVLIRTQKLDNVFVLPSDAVVREGPEAFVFTQNVNTFEKKPCILLHQDHRQVVIANNGLLLPGSFVVQSAAAQLNRMVKSGTTGLPKGYHIHADGSLHKNEDEGK